MVVADAVAPRGERIKVLDFGIAKLTEASGFVQGDTTRSNLLMGTPRYMSPEQCRGAGKTDAKADVYSLGVLLFQFLAGRLPFVSTAPGELIVMHMTEPPPPLLSLAPGAPLAAATLVEQMLAKPAAGRPTMAEVAQQLQAMLRLIEGRPGSSVEVAAVAASAGLPGSPPTVLGPAAAALAVSPAAPSLLPSSPTPLSVTSYEVEASSSPGASGPVPVAASSTLGQSLGQSLGPLPASGAGRRRYLLVAPAVALLLITAVGARRLLAPAAATVPAVSTLPLGREPPARAPDPPVPPSPDRPSADGPAAAAVPAAAAGKDAAHLGSRATSRPAANPPPRAPLRRPPAKKSERKPQGEKSLFDSID